jgi:hypothetical protein
MNLSPDTVQIIEIVVPSVVIFLAIVNDISSFIQAPKWVSVILYHLCSPFQNFLNLKDLPGPVDSPAVPSKLKSRAMIALATFEAILWFTAVVFAWTVVDLLRLIKSVFGTIHWVFLLAFLH